MAFRPQLLLLAALLFLIPQPNLKMNARQRAGIKEWGVNVNFSYPCNAVIKRLPRWICPGGVFCTLF